MLALWLHICCTGIFWWSLWKGEHKNPISCKDKYLEEQICYSKKPHWWLTYVYSTLFLLFFRIVLLIILIILFLRLNTSLLESSKLKNDSCRHGVSATASKSSFGSGRICLISAKCHILITYLSLMWKAASYVAFVKCLYLVTGVTWAAEFPQTAMDAIFIDVPADPVTT